MNGEVKVEVKKAEVKLALSRTDPVVGESADLAFTFTNISPAPLTLPDPQRSQEWPRIRIRDKQKGTEEVYGPGGVAARQSHEFPTPVPAITLTLAPGQQAHSAGDLLTWVALPAPGQYALTAEIETPAGVAASPPVTINVQPLDLRSAFTVGGDSGPSPYRYCVWAQAQGAGSAILLTCVMFDAKGNPRQTQSVRAAEVNRSVHPVPSVPPNGHPFPVQWLAWQEGDLFSGLYLEQTQIKVPLHSHPLNLPEAKLIGPGLLDVSKADSNHPARGEFAFWQSSVPHARMLWRNWEADGSLSVGQSTDVASGALQWGETTLLKSGERRVVCAVRRGGKIELELTRWGRYVPPPARPIVQGAGEFLGAGMTLGSDDTLHGAMLLRNGNENAGCLLYSWTADANGDVHAAAPTALAGEGSPAFTRALMEISPQNRILLLLRTQEGRWYASIGGRVPAPLPDSLASYGEPTAAYWRDEAAPFVVMAGAQTGLTYQRLP